MGGEVIISVFNEMGELALQHTQDKMPASGILLDIHELPSGLYFINIQSEGLKSDARSFVKVE
jgi:hypothetical protein